MAERRKNRRDQDLRDAVDLVKSARKMSSPWNGGRKGKAVPRRKGDEEDVLKEAASLIPSARQFKRSMWPDDKEMQHAYVDQLITWSEQETSEDIDDWFRSKRVGPISFYRACEDDKYLNESLSLALANIGKRIKDKVRATNEFNMRQYPKYDSLSLKEAREKLDADKQRKEDTKFEVTVNRG